MTINTTISHIDRPRVSLGLRSADDVVSIADDVNIARQLRREHVISNSLDID